MRLRQLARLGAGVVVVAGTFGVAGPAAADGAGGSSAGACGAATYCVSVSYSGTAAPHGGGDGGGGYVATVAPDCWWGDPVTVKEALEHRNKSYSGPGYSGKEWVLGLGDVEQYEKAMKQKPQPLVYNLSCRDDVSVEQQSEYAGTAATVGWGMIPNLVRFIEPGEQPPPPAVSVDTLRDAAYNSIDIPEPTVARNPEISGSGATLVTLPTMFWAEDYRDTWDITASVGPVSATVVAKADSFTLTSPAGGTTCDRDQFYAAYTSPDSVDSGCTIAFQRASNGNPFPVDINATWTASWTGNPGPNAPQALPAISTQGSTTVPVAESQAIVDSADGDGNP